MTEKMGYLTKSDADKVRELMKVKDDLMLLLDDNTLQRTGQTSRPPICCLLLDKCYTGEQVDAMVMAHNKVNQVQRVQLRGYVTGGTFTLTYNGVESDPIPYNATQKEFTLAMEANGDQFRPFELVVSPFIQQEVISPTNGATNQWIVEFRGRYSGYNELTLPLLVADYSGLNYELTQARAVTVQRTRFTPVGKIEKLTNFLTVGNPTPLIYGTQTVAIYVPGSGYVPIAAECTDYGQALLDIYV